MRASAALFLGWSAALLAGCTCGTDDDEAGGFSFGGNGGSGGGQTSNGGQGGEGGLPNQTACHVDTVTPAVNATSIEVVGTSVLAHYNKPIDAATLTGITLTRLDDGFAEDADVTLSDPQTVQITPHFLRYWASYSVDLPGTIATTDGEACLQQASTFSTLQPVADAIDPRPAPVTGVAVAGSFAFVASAELPGLQSFDISDPSAPTLAKSVQMPHTAYGVRVFGQRAYVPAGSFGVYVYDISDPSSPTLLGVAGTPGFASDVAEIDQDGRKYLAVADGWLGLIVLDVTDPEGTTTVSTHYFGNTDGANFLSLDGNELAVGLSTQFAVLDMSSVTVPTVELQRPSEPLPTTFNNSYPPTAILLDSGRIYIGIGHLGVQSFDVNGNTADFVDFSPGPDGTCQYYCTDRIMNLAKSGNTLFATSFMHGGVRLSDDGTGQLSAMEVFPMSARSHGLALAGNNVLIGSDSGLEVIAKTAAPSDAPLFTEQSSWGIVHGVAGTGDTLFTAAQGLGLVSYDMDLAKLDVVPTFGGSLDYSAWDVTVQDKTLFFSDARGGFSLYDLTDPTQPFKLSEVSAPNFDFVDGVWFDDTNAFVCNGNAPMRIYDISDPSAPNQIGEVALNADIGGCARMVRDGNVMYVAGSLGLGILDVSDPANTSLTNVVTLPPNAPFNGLALKGKTLYATSTKPDWEAGSDAAARRLVAFDITNATAPERVFTSDDLDLGGRLALRGEKLFVSGANGVTVFDLRDPHAPEVEGVIEASSTIGLYFTADTLFVGVRGSGVVPIHTGRTE